MTQSNFLRLMKKSMNSMEFITTYGRQAYLRTHLEGDVFIGRTSMETYNRESWVIRPLQMIRWSLSAVDQVRIKYVELVTLHIREKEKCTEYIRESAADIDSISFRFCTRTQQWAN